MVTKATNNGKRRIRLFLAKSKFSLNSSTNITLNVAEKALQPTNGVFKRIPPLDEPNESGRDVSESSDQSRLEIDTDSFIPPR